jgi:alcohol dehydrogenase class IV
MRFEFSTANRIVFGNGTRNEIGAIAAALHRRGVVITGRDSTRAEFVRGCLEASGVDCATVCIASEPSVQTVGDAAAIAHQSGAGVIIGIGGGSVLDAAKAIAALATNTGDPFEFLEVVGRGQPLLHPPLPVIAVPTTAGTGSEVTRNAVLSCPAHRVKVSLRDPRLLPRVAVIDPELTHSLPQHLTASTGLDALTQLIEAFLCSRANPLTDALCRDAIPRAARSLRVAYMNPTDAEARFQMSLASVASGVALANAGLGAVHGLAGPIGGMYPIAHGALCAALLSSTLEVNFAALKSRQPNSGIAARFVELAQLLTGNARATASEGLTFVRELVSELRIERLEALGVRAEDHSEIIRKASASSSMKANPISLLDAEIAEILARS